MINVRQVFEDDFQNFVEVNGIPYTDTISNQGFIVNMLAVGYFIDTENLENSYIEFKTHWGTEFGDNGFLKVKLFNVDFINGDEIL